VIKLKPWAHATITRTVEQWVYAPRTAGHGSTSRNLFSYAEWVRSNQESIPDPVEFEQAYQQRHLNHDYRQWVRFGRFGRGPTAYQGMAMIDPRKETEEA
jgi:hypothetical protein